MPASWLSLARTSFRTDALRRAPSGRNERGGDHDVLRGMRP
jgi:hypothetical protein